MYNEKRGFRKFDTHRIDWRARGTEENNIKYKATLSKWTAEQGLIEITKSLNILKDIKTAKCGEP